MAGHVVAMGGLDVMPESFCPHDDGEERRRPVHEHFVASGALAPDGSMPLETRVL